MSDIFLTKTHSHVEYTIILYSTFNITTKLHLYDIHARDERRNCCQLVDLTVQKVTMTRLDTFFKSVQGDHY